jgi:hypothetical protein
VPDLFFSDRTGTRYTSCLGLGVDQGELLLAGSIDVSYCCRLNMMALASWGRLDTWCVTSQCRRAVDAAATYRYADKHKYWYVRFDMPVPLICACFCLQRGFWPGAQAWKSTVASSHPSGSSLLPSWDQPSRSAPLGWDQVVSCGTPLSQMMAAGRTQAWESSRYVAPRRALCSFCSTELSTRAMRSTSILERKLRHCRVLIWISL